MHHFQVVFVSVDSKPVENKKGLKEQLFLKGLVGGTLLATILIRTPPFLLGFPNKKTEGDNEME